MLHVVLFELPQRIIALATSRAEAFIVLTTMHNEILFPRSKTAALHQRVRNQGVIIIGALDNNCELGFGLNLLMSVLFFHSV